MRNDNTNPDDFEKSAKKWLALFLLPLKENWMIGEEIISGLYFPSEITPYIHVLVCHVADMIRNNKKWGLKVFSCAAVEKKNYQHISYFFRKTLKDGAICKIERHQSKNFFIMKTEFFISHIIITLYILPIPKKYIFDNTCNLLNNIYF